MMKTFGRSTSAASAIALLLFAFDCLVKAQEFAGPSLATLPREELAREPTISTPTNSPPTTILISTQPEEYALKKLTVIALNATSVEVVFVLPSFAVNRRGKAELNYTGVPLNDDESSQPEKPPHNAIWLRRQNIKTAGGIFPRSTIKYYLGNLKPSFRYWFKLSVHFQDQEPPFDEPLEGNMEYVDMPSRQNLVPFTTTTSPQPSTTEPATPTTPIQTTQPSSTTTASTSGSTTTTGSTTTNTPEPITSPTTTTTTSPTTRASTTMAQSITIKPVTATTTVANPSPQTTARSSSSATTIETTPQIDPKINSTSSPIMSTILTILNATQPINLASPAPNPVPTETSSTTASTTTTTTTTTTSTTTTTPPPASSTELLTSTESSGRSASFSTPVVELETATKPRPLWFPTVPASASSAESTSTLSVLASTITGAATSKPIVSSESLVTSDKNSTRKPPVTSSWTEQLYQQLNAPLQRYALYLLVALLLMTILFIFVSYKYFKKSSRVRMAQITSQPAYDNPSFTKLVSYYANQNYHNDALLAKQKNLEVDKTSPFHVQHNQLNDIHHHHHHNQNGKQHLI